MKKSNVLIIHTTRNFGKHAWALLCSTVLSNAVGLVNCLSTIEFPINRVFRSFHKSDRSDISANVVDFAFV